MLVFLHLSRLEHGSGIAQIPNAQKKTQLHIDEFMLVEFITISKTFSNNFKLITNSKNVLLVHEIVEKHHAASRKCKTQFGRKTSWFVVVEKPSCTSRKNKVAPKRPNSLANALHAASEFRKQRLTFLSINIITRFFAVPCKGQKTMKIVSFPDVIPPFCSKFSAVNKKLHCCNQIPHATSSCQRNVAHVHHINGSLYFHTPFCYDSHAAWLSKRPTCSTMHCICIHIIRKTIVRIRTRSHLFPAVADVSKIPVYVNYSCVIVVVCVRILIDAEN